jgi:hypothetical protein
MIPPVQHDVLRFQVAVDDPVLVEVVQRQQHLFKYIKHYMVTDTPSFDQCFGSGDPIGSGFNRVPGYVSGSRRAKITNKN